LKKLLASISMLFGLSGAAHATLIEMVFNFKDGFPAYLSGGASAPTGPLTFRVLLDSATPDLHPSGIWGNFAAESVQLTAPSLGLADEPAVVPDLTVLMGQGAILIRSVGTELQLGGFVGDEALMRLTSDVNDLRALALPAVATIPHTFFVGAIALQNGDTLVGNIGFGGPQGAFRAAVPEPTILGLSLALAGFYFAGRYRPGLRSASGHSMDV